MLLASCGTMPPAQEQGRPAERPPHYSLVFIIHGDADYTYHDALGHKHRADQDILAQAQEVGERSPDADVFIFHQIARKHFLFVVPRRDGRAYHYRNGRLMAQEAYWRDQGTTRFAPELRIYHRLAEPPSPSLVRLFFYFGHELPEMDGAGYDASCRERRVTVADLAEAVRDVAGSAAKVDLLGLATCFGGTPHTVGALGPYARYIIASPDNLHLSSFDLAPLESLDLGSDDGAVAAFADRFARNAFERLASTVQTAVSVVVYDVNGTRAFLDSVTGPYDRTLASTRGRSPSSEELCGRLKHEVSHSGWECWRSAR
jgi:hypothetical protein